MARYQHNPPLKKSEIVKIVREKSGLPESQCKMIINLFLDTVKETLETNRSVSIHKFGLFYVKKSPKRTYFSVKKQEMVDVPSKKKAMFSETIGVFDFAKKIFTNSSVDNP